MIDHANELRRHARKIPHPQGETPGVMLRAADEIERLRAKIAEMERQEPVATIHINSITGNPSVDFIPGHRYLHHNSSLYSLPGAQPAPSVPTGWLRAIDEALIVAHIGMANADDTYAQAKSKLDTLIGLHVDVATDPAVNGGWKLVPTAESRHPGIHKMLNALHAVDNTPGASEWESYAAFLAATPEANP